MYELATEQRLGPYRLLREAGQGGMALVFEALDTRTGQKAAVKLLKTPMLTPERREERLTLLRREGEILAGLSAPHVVGLQQGLQSEPGPVEDMHYLVMDYLEGRTLRAHLAQKRISPDQILFLLEPIAEALDALHAAEILYRDLKPSNIMLLHDGDVRLIDFGMALRPADRQDAPVVGLVGSPSYLAPERIAGKIGTPASDIWSFGVVLYEMLTGQLPFTGDSIGAVLRRIAHAPPTPLPPASHKIERVLLRALEKKPGRRYRSARALVADYAEAIGVPSRWSPPVPQAGAAGGRPSRRAPALWAVGSVAALAACTLIGLVVSHETVEAPLTPIVAPPLPSPVQTRVAASIQERRRPHPPAATPRSVAPRPKTVPMPRAVVAALPKHTPKPFTLKPAPPSPRRPLRVAELPHLTALPRPAPVPSDTPPASAETAVLPTPTATAALPALPVKARGDYAVTPLGPLGQDVQALNDRGQTVGGLNGAAVLWQDGALRPLGHTADVESEAAAVNDRGQVVGFMRAHAFLWQDGVIHDLGTLAGPQSNATAINDAGEVVGTSDNVAVLWKDGKVVSLGTLGGDGSHARAINDAGQVAGVSYTAHGSYHAFLWQGGVMRDLGTLGGPCSMGVAINDHGQVAGLSVTAAGDTHACLWDGTGRATDLGALHTTSQAYGIGPGDEVVGASDGRAVLWRGGHIFDLNRCVGSYFDGVLERAVSINGAGQILCFGRSDGVVRAYLLTPAQ